MKQVKSKWLLAFLTTITTLLVVVILIVNIILGINDNEPLVIIILYFSLIIVSSFIYIILMMSFWIGRYAKTINLINTLNSVDSIQAELFKIGTIFFNQEGIITFITPWLQKQGFEGMIGKKVSTIEIDVELTEKQFISNEMNKWEITSSFKNGFILVKDITETHTLKSIIDSQLKAVISFNISFSKRIELNDSTKASATLKINQTIKEWINKNGGLLNASLNTEGTLSGIFNWRKGEKDVRSKFILDAIKKTNPKMNKDITVFIGVSYGDEDYVDLLDSSLKSLEISKNRGGDQIIIALPNGEFDYIGVSESMSVNDVSDSSIKNFHIEFMDDLQRAKEIFITSHKIADLDALGSSLGAKELANIVNNNVYIVIEHFDTSAQRFYNSLPKKIKDSFITEKQAKTKINSRSHFIIVDSSNPNSTQADSILSNIPTENISIIDHHRIAKNSFNYNEGKTLIITTSSSASELIVELLKISLGGEAQLDIDQYVASGLISGIKLDTKQLTKNITDSTFEALAWLMNNESGLIEIDSLFKLPQNLIKLESEAFSNIIRPSKNIIFTHINENKIINEEDTSILADKLLEYDGVKATFVLARVDEKKYKMSARSNNDVNVQSIAEKFGGGGHFNVAASTWTTKTKFSNIKTKIKKELEKIK